MAGFNSDLAALWGAVNGMVEGFFALLPSLLIAAVVFVGFWFAGRLAKYVIQNGPPTTRTPTSASCWDGC